MGVFLKNMPACPICLFPRNLLIGGILLCCLLSVLLCSEAGADNTRRVDDAAAFAIVNNPPSPLQWGSYNFITPLLESYEEHDIFEPRVAARGRREIDSAAFVQRLRLALGRRSVVDLFILAHGNDYYRLLDGIEPSLRQRLRLVYNSGCGDAHDARQWQLRGVRAYVSHPDYSMSPVFLNRFRTYWWSGRTLKEAVTLANERLHQVFVERRGFDLLEAWYLIVTRRRGEQAYRNTLATLFGEEDLTITTDAAPPRNTVVLRGG